jgi:P27 family predicted phage terminase small subunit
MTARKPVEQRIREGNPGKRKLPTALTVVPPAAPANREPPPGLGAAGLVTWNMAIDKAGRWIADSDLATLRHLCMAEDRYAGLLAELAENGYVLYTDKGYAYQNPAVGALATKEDQIRKWLSLLGLTPADRVHLGVQVVSGQSKLEEMMARRPRA